MSGGAYDYAYSKVQSMAENLRFSTEPIPCRRWFAKHLVLVAQAMYACEWEDSGDSGSEETKKAIAAVMKHGKESHG